jgi:hypothetical protein
MIEYQEYFLTIKNINKWYDNLNKVKKYIDNKKKNQQKQTKMKNYKNLENGLVYNNQIIIRKKKQ